jgi:general secretion pathway protein M
MMKLLNEPRTRRRILFLLGNLAALATFVSIFVAPVFDVFAERDAKIEQQAKRLSRLTAIASEAARVETVVAQAKTQMQTGEFLTGANENVISAELQTRLKAMTEAVGARSRAIQALPVKMDDQMKSAGARIEIFGSLQSIARAVYAIETAKPYLFISAASLKLAPGSTPGAPQEPVVQAQLDVFGAIQIGGQP